MTSTQVQILIILIENEIEKTKQIKSIVNLSHCSTKLL
jgi:hypothetical protein